jgi:hypothetical protein
MPIPPIDRVMGRVNIDRETGCWNWTGSTNSAGYGVIGIGSRVDKSCKIVTVHRLVWQHEKGSIPESFCVCHHCDNRKCVNPEHLFLGTNQDNVDDKERKNRSNHPVGSRCAKSIFTNSDVENIVRLFSIGKSNVDIASLYRCHYHAIWNIRHGIRWGWLTGIKKCSKPTAERRGK